MPVSADRPIGLTAEKHHLPDRAGKGRQLDPVGQRQWIETQQGPGKKRYQQALSPGMHFLAGKTGQQIGLFPFQGSYKGAQRAWHMPGIGIGEEKQIALGLVRQLAAGPVLAQLAFRRGNSLQHTQAWFRSCQVFQDRSSPIFRLVVQDKQLKKRIILRQQRSNTAGNVLLFIPGREQDRDHWENGWRNMPPGTVEDPYVA